MRQLKLLLRIVWGLRWRIILSLFVFVFSYYVLLYVFQINEWLGLFALGVGFLVIVYDYYE